MINMIQMSRNGPIVAPIQDLWYDPDRNVQPVFTSGDNGKSWTKSNVIDLGGHGHHDGAMESIVIELNDRRVWMLIRTNWDYFWEAYSMDEGLSWRIIPADGHRRQQRPRVHPQAGQRSHGACLEPPLP